MAPSRIATYIPGTSKFRRRGPVPHILWLAFAGMFMYLTVKAWAIGLDTSFWLLFAVWVGMTVTLTTKNDGATRSYTLFPGTVGEAVKYAVYGTALVFLLMHGCWVSAAFYGYWLSIPVRNLILAAKTAKAPAP